MLAGKSVGEAADLIRGPVGTKVVLTVLPPKAQEPYQVTLERAPLELAGVPDSSYASFIGKPAPDLGLSALEPAEVRRLSDYRGKIVVLDFWASWCPTCFPPVTKMQALAERHQDWQGKVELIAVTVDADLSLARAQIKKQAWHKTRNCAVAFDDLKKLGVSVIPLVIIIAPDGTIAAMAAAQALDVEKEVQSLLTK
ncbi:MAG: thiol-disulfide isomerase-like thioredoxin [Verrucomicrobia bacterium]|jgi:peroxiredoxin|nr:thiol-disulfide isomerase-like thioredoxin [Verrucomicrobiota bacterium]